MKRVTLILGFLVSLAAVRIVLGQSVSGVIQYETKVNLHRNLPPDREELKNVIPAFRISKQQLFFNGEESLYKRLEEDQEEEMDTNHGGMTMRIMQPQVEMYSNQATSQRITEQEFAGKNYLIEDTLSVLPWKFGAETKVIAGLECRQASMYNEERKQNIVAWYSVQLRPFLGPEMFNSLPGAVLMVDINDGERIIIAKSVEQRPLKKNELKIPVHGTRITQKEFRKLMEQQMERMRTGGGNMIIRN